MGFRFRHSIRILPRVRLNIGKRGVSTSLGVRGAHITLGHGQVRQTVGIPGSGLSYTHVSRSKSLQAASDAPGEARPPADQRHVSLVKLLVLVALIGLLVYFLTMHTP